MKKKQRDIKNGVQQHGNHFLANWCFTSQKKGLLKSKHTIFLKLLATPSYVLRLKKIFCFCGTKNISQLKLRIGITTCLKINTSFTDCGVWGFFPFYKNMLKVFLIWSIFLFCRYLVFLSLQFKKAELIHFESKRIFLRK